MQAEAEARAHRADVPMDGAEAQLKTDRKLEKLIDLWQRRTPNGRG